jgi:hypothetical protein
VAIISYDELSLFCSFLKSYDAFNKSAKEYKEKSLDGNREDVIKDLLIFAKDSGIIDSIIEKYPKSGNTLGQIDSLSSVIKSYGKNESGEYKSMGETFKDVVADRIREMLFGK